MSIFDNTYGASSLDQPNFTMDTMFFEVIKAGGSMVWVGAGGKGKTLGARLQQASLAHLYASKGNNNVPVCFFNTCTLSFRYHADQASQFIAFFCEREAIKSNNMVHKEVIALRAVMSDTFAGQKDLLSRCMDRAVKTSMIKKGNGGLGKKGSDSEINQVSSGLKEELVRSFSDDAIISPASLLADTRINDAFVSFIEELLMQRAEAPEDGSQPALMIGVAMMKLTRAMHHYFGNSASQLSEFGITDAGITASVGRHDVNEYIVTLGEFEYRIRGMKHINIALALSYGFATRISSLGSMFAEEIAGGALLTGGLSEDVPYTVQMMNDTCTRTGAFVIVELRDDFDKSASDNFSTDLTDTQRRMIASSRCAIYLTDLGVGHFRLRAYDPSEPEGIEPSVRIDLQKLVDERAPFIDPTTKQASFPQNASKVVYSSVFRRTLKNLGQTSVQ
jgi:hypothetical protein